MKVFKITIYAISFMMCNLVTSQDLTEKQKEIEKNKVEIYTSDEKDNIQMWFYNKTNEMNLTKTC